MPMEPQLPPTSLLPMPLALDYAKRQEAAVTYSCCPNQQHFDSLSMAPHSASSRRITTAAATPAHLLNLAAADDTATAAAAAAAVAHCCNARCCEATPASWQLCTPLDLSLQLCQQ